MPANLTSHVPVIALSTVSGNTPQTVSVPELASQTFKIGTPVQVASSGYLQAWDGTTVAAGILGFTPEFGHNLASNGKGAPQPFGQIGPPGAIQTWGNVQNEPSAVNIAIGTPITDGRCLVETADGDTVFEIQVDNSAGSVAADYTPAATDLYKQFGMTVDSNGTWYLDRGKTTVGTNTVLQLVGFSPVDGLIVNARVRVIVTIAARQAQQ